MSFSNLVRRVGWRWKAGWCSRSVDGLAPPARTGAGLSPCTFSVKYSSRNWPIKSASAVSTFVPKTAASTARQRFHWELLSNHVARKRSRCPRRIFGNIRFHGSMTCPRQNRRGTPMDTQGRLGEFGKGGFYQCERDFALRTCIEVVGIEQDVRIDEPANGHALAPG